MRRLAERMNLAKIVLRELSNQPLRRSDLEQRTIRRAGTRSMFDGIFRYLIESGYVQKSGQRHRANYVITEKGNKLLEAIQ